MLSVEIYIICIETVISRTYIVCIETAISRTIEYKLMFLVPVFLSYSPLFC